MHIKHLNLVNVRNYSSVDISLKPGTNLLIGGNGEGKTTLVESIIYSSLLKSHRVSSFIPMIQKGKTQALVRALAGFQDRENLIEVELNIDSPHKKLNLSSIETLSISKWVPRTQHRCLPQIRKLYYWCLVP